VLAKRAAPQRAHGAANRVRIIGGQYRRRLLDFPGSAGLRPTPDRVRETLFNWLGQDLPGWRCLDLFAGSGALGFEALSRGAAEVTFVERDSKAAAALRNTARLLESEHATVRCESASVFLQNSKVEWDIVFFDPPFRHTGWDRLLDLLLDEHLSTRGVIYIERSVREELPHPDLLHKQSRAGDCRFGLLARP
jgi:16S rRNA (guanine966-N2)-methyltransferase